MNCNNCSKIISSNTRGIYCHNCFTIRKRDICEIIDNSGSHILNSSNLNELQSYINNVITVRLDLHGVLDTIPHTHIFDNFDKMCCISFVGSTTKTRLSARNDISRRIGHQISYGVLIFSRGGPKYHDIGSKAWINSIIPLPINTTGIFIDDSNDHYESVKSFKIFNLKSHLYNKSHDNLFKLINHYI